MVVTHYSLGGGSYNGVAIVGSQDNLVTSAVEFEHGTPRIGDTTRTKQKGVTYIVKVL